MKHLVAFAMFAGLGLGGASVAQAAPVAPGLHADGASVQLVAEGCGPRAFRDRFGRCRYAGGPPPRFRGCPPYTHPTPYGCRRN